MLCWELSRQARLLCLHRIIISASQHTVQLCLSFTLLTVLAPSLLPFDVAAGAGLHWRAV